MEEQLLPILTRLNVQTVDDTTPAYMADVPGMGTVTFTLANDKFTYTRDLVGSNSFKLSEIKAIEHYLAPVFRYKDRVSGPYIEIDKDDVMVRLHCLLPGDVFIATYRVCFIGAGTQQTRDVYIVR